MQKKKKEKKKKNLQKIIKYQICEGSHNVKVLQLD